MEISVARGAIARNTYSMKFYCDSCGAKYLIGDDKVRGKVLRIRCKKCEHVIVVREPSSPASSQVGSLQQLKSRLQAKGAEQADIPWYYSIAGKTFGPMPLQELRGMFQSRELGDETYVWNETFDAWKPAPQCPTFVDLFQKGAVRKARNPTISLSTEDVQAVNQAAARLGAGSTGASGSNILKRASRNTGL